VGGSDRLPPYASLFFELLLGLTVWVVCYSIIKTKFITVNFIFIVAAYLLIREQRKVSLIQRERLAEDPISNKIGWTGFLLITLVSFIIFSWSYLIFQPDAGWIDNMIYARQSHFLPLTGQENEFYIYNLLSEKYHGTSPYYYYMLWSDALVNQFFGGNSAINFTLFFPSVCLFIFYIGILALWERVRKVNLLVIIISPILLFTGGLVFGFYSEHSLLFTISVYSWSMPISIIKFFPLYLFYLSFVILLLYNSPVQASILLACVGLVAITAVPAVIGGIILFAFLAWRLHLYEKGILKRIIFNFFVIILLIIVFYLVFGGKNFQRSNSIVSQPAIEKVIQNIFDPDNIRTRINIVAHALIFIWIPYILFTALLVLIWKRLKNPVWRKSLQTILLAGSCIFISSLLGWMCLFDEIASNRIFESSAPMINCCMIFCLIVFLSTSIEKKYFFPKYPVLVYVVIIIFGFSAYHQMDIKLEKLNYHFDSNSGHSKVFMDEISKAINSGEVGKLGAGMKGEKNFEDEIYGYVTFNTIRGDYLFLLNNDWITLSISDYTESTIKPDSGFTNKLFNKRREKYLSLGIFYQFVQQQKKENQFLSVEQSQIDFINKYKISYIIASPEAEVPGLLQEKVKREITDSETGDRFIILKT